MKRRTSTRPKHSSNIEIACDSEQESEANPPRRQFWRAYPITLALILLNWGISLLCVCSASFDRFVNTQCYISGYYFLAGEWWRPLSGMFMHQGPLHLVINTLFLFMLCRKVERAAGHIGFLFLYLATGLAASLAAFINPMRAARGSSGAVFGICGAFFFLHYFVLSRVSRSARLTAVGWLVVTIIAFGPPQRSAIAAHGIGLVAGFLGMLLIWSPRFRIPRRNRWKTSLCLAGCVAMLAAMPLLIYPNPIRLAAIAQAKIQRGEYEQALESLAPLTRFFPTFVWAYLNRAFCYECLDQKDLASEEIERGLFYCPDSFWLWKQRGEANLDRGLLTRAGEDFDQAWRLSGGNTGLRDYCQGRLSLWQGEYSRAIEEFSSALQNRWSPDAARCQRGIAYCALGQLPEAEADWRQAIAISTEPYTKGLCLNYLGFLELRRGHWEQAVRYANDKEVQIRGLSSNGLLRLIAIQKMGIRDNSIQSAQVYQHLKKSDLVVLKALLPQELWHYLDPIGN